jgi:nucleoid DNA-binding protein
MSFTRRDLICDLSDAIGMTQRETEKIVESMLALISGELAKGNEVSLRGFGTFEVHLAKARIGRNPKRPGSDMLIPARSVVRFRPSKEVKVLVASAPPKLETAGGLAARAA